MVKSLLKNLTFQVLTAIAIGLTIGYVQPTWGVALQPLGEGFIRLIKMVVGPIVFLTIAGGIASMGGLRKAGRVGGKALIYFEVITTLALAIGLLVANVVQPGKRDGHGIAMAVACSTERDDVSPSAESTSSQPTNAATDAEVAKIAHEARQHSLVNSLLGVIPVSVVAAHLPKETCSRSCSSRFCSARRWPVWGCGFNAHGGAGAIARGDVSHRRHDHEGRPARRRWERWPTRSENSVSHRSFRWRS